MFDILLDTYSALKHGAVVYWIIVAIEILFWCGVLACEVYLFRIAFKWLVYWLGKSVE